MGKQLKPIHAGHLDIEDGQIDGLLLHCLERLSAVGVAAHSEPFGLERHGDGGQDVSVVVDERDGTAHESVLLLYGRGPQRLPRRPLHHDRVSPLTMAPFGQGSGLGGSNLPAFPAVSTPLRPACRTCGPGALSGGSNPVRSSSAWLWPKTPEPIRRYGRPVRSYARQIAPRSRPLGAAGPSHRWLWWPSITMSRRFC